MKKRLHQWLWAGVAGVWLLTSSGAGTAAGAVEGRDAGSKECGLRLAMREAWEGYCQWKRIYLISELAGIPGRGKAADEFLKQTMKIGEVFEPYLDSEKSLGLFDLLKQHGELTINLIRAGKTRQNREWNRARNAWFKNSGELAAFFHLMRWAWPRPEMESRLANLHSLNTRQIQARISRRWDLDADAAEIDRDQILKLADYLAEGLIRDFLESGR